MSQKAFNDYKDLYLVPQYSEITSRQEVNTGQYIDQGLTISIPAISANMDTVTDGHMALCMARAGGVGAIHRFMSVEQNVEEFLIPHNEGQKCFVSIGVNMESKERAKALWSAGARYFVVDIAHGHSVMMKNLVSWMRQTWGNDPYIVAGNVATPEGVHDLFSWGADAVKIGIGPGAVCTTKNVTGVTVPQALAVKNCCAEYKNNYRLSLTNRPALLIADGGVSEIGDIAKALALGANLVMCGKLFAGCKEAPGPRVNGRKVYRGMASRDAMLTIKDANLLPTPEGISTFVEESEQSAAEVVQHIRGGLQSAFSYANSRNLSEFQRFAKIGVR